MAGDAEGFLEELRADGEYLPSALLGEILRELENRQLSAVLITLDSDTLTAMYEFRDEGQDLSGVAANLENTSDLDTSDVRMIVKILGMSMMKQDGGV